MAFRSLTIIASTLLLTLLLSSPVQACFGPKLFVGVAQEPQQEILFALITLYVQEKTGVESTRVEVAEDQVPVALLADEKVDLVFVARNDSVNTTVFQIADLPLMVTGSRPLGDLQLPPFCRR